MLITMTLGTQSTPTALADNEPAETVLVAVPPPPPPHRNPGGHISQTTEHLLIAAGSIGKRGGWMMDDGRLDTPN
jgi:hypothetical protein